MSCSQSLASTVAAAPTSSQGGFGRDGYEHNDDGVNIFQPSAGAVSQPPVSAASAPAVAVTGGSHP